MTTKKMMETAFNDPEKIERAFKRWEREKGVKVIDYEEVTDFIPTHPAAAKGRKIYGWMVEIA